MEVAEGGGIGVDCSMGTIVWVRRRNGSWWPGRILGSDELSASHLISPRSGTPVKLLGREDASVDWYNLEKSKRIKAFRCGEFGDCIERAEASKSIPIKKREKYACREDAILHALELEKQQLELKQQILGVTSSGISNKSTGAYEREPVFLSSPEICMRHDEPVTHGKLSSQKSNNFLKTVGFSLEEEGVVTRGRGNQQFIWEDNPEAAPQMRGLQDFGLQMAQSKIKPSLSVTWENSGKSVDDHVESLSCSGYMVEGAGQAGSVRNTMSDKKKRSCSGSTEEVLVKKRDRRRPLVQVLQSSAKLPPRSFQPGYSFTGISSKEETNLIGSSCRAKQSRCVYLPVDLDDHPDHGGYTSEHMPVSAYQFGMDNDINHPGNMGGEYTSSILIEVNASHYLEDDLLEHDMVEETNMIMDTADILVPGLKEFEPPEFQVSGKFKSLVMDESSISGFRPKSHGQTEDASSDMGVSRWHMKGKRNNRNIGKRLMDASDVKICNTALQKCSAYINAATYENKGSRLKFGRAETYSQSVPGWGVYPIKEELQYAYDDGNLIDKDLDQNHLIPLPLQPTNDCDRSHSGLNDSDEDFHGRNPSVLEPSDLACNSFWEEPVECLNEVYDSHPGTKMEPLLVDVDLKAQASYQGEHVPLVSLMSRLNGKAIIGHPVQVDILGDGSVSHLISTCDSGMGESAAPPAVWRTARRTAMQRVPCSIHSTAALEEEEADLFQYSDSESKPLLHKKPYSDYINHQMRPDKKRGFLFYQSGLGKFQKKRAKRVSFSSQKRRTLSSLSSDVNLDGGNSLKLARSNDVLGGSIKPESSVPFVACVTVKVVFSRILQAVGRPSAVSHPARMKRLATQGLS